MVEYLPSWHYLQPQVKHQLMSLQYEFINELTIYKVLVFQVLSMCICTTFEDADWLSCWGSHMSYDVHGVYPDDVDDLSKEAYLEMYLKETNPIICESDDEFINMCKQIKGK